MNDQDFWTVKAMRVFGGSFVVALADCMERADESNFAKIKITWPEYMKQYEEMGQKLKQEGGL